MTEPRPDEFAALEQDVSRLLGDLGEVEPPANLSRDVMQAISTRRAQGDRGSRAVGVTEGGWVMGRKVMYGLAAAAAVVLVLFATTGFPPIGRGTEGTVDGARRYQAQQLADKDVVLGDPAAQQFLQSDVFDRLMRDETARKALANGNLRDALMDVSLANALGRAEIAHALADSGLNRMFTDAELASALAAPSLASALSNQELAREFFDAALRGALSGPDLAARIQGTALARELAANAALAHAVANPALAGALSDVEFSRSLQRLVGAGAFADPAFLRGLSNGAFLKAMADPQLRSYLTDSALSAALSTPGFSQAILSQRFQAELAGR
jgi:hypothetical protein